ncbi:hypothetical protein BsWGS_27999 [Bradybaena similaris]
MVTEGQRRQGLKLTDQDVRSAASLILDELLEDRIDKDLRGHRKIRRIRTGPESTNLGIHISESENAVARSKTLPANYRELTNGELKQKNVEESLDKIHRDLKQKNVEEPSDKIHRDLKQKNVEEPSDKIHCEDNTHIVDSSGSSADTEDNSSNIYEKRKKKSFLKRARERFHLAFHRNHNVENATAKEANDRSRTEKKKMRKSAGKSKNESQHHVQARTGGGFVDDTTGQVDYVDKGGSVPAGSHSAKKWNSKILSSFRKSKKSHEESGDARYQKKTDGKVHVRENGHNGIEQSAPGKVLPPSLLQVQSRSQGVLSSPQHPLTPQQDRDSPKQPQSPGQQERDSPKQPQSPGHFQSQGDSVASSHEAASSSPGASTILIGTSIFSQTNAISASPDNSQRPYIGYRSLVFNTSVGSNVLDSPGDDIEFIDALDTENLNESSKGNYSKQVQNPKSVYQFHAGYPKNSRSPNQFADGSHVTDVEVDPQGQRPDGGAEAAGLFTARHVAVPSQPEEEVYDELDGEVDDECDSSLNSDPDKEALYSAIAQRLIEMGDSYSASVSDLKSKSDDPESMEHLSPLETDIVNCLRSVGDKITRQSKQSTYHRFQSTVQNTFQGDISWNHLVLLFYATKNVVSFVGKGSQAAVLAKDFTVQYVSDSCASWIIDQVGSDILQSSEESDFGVD